MKTGQPKTSLALIPDEVAQLQAKPSFPKYLPDVHQGTGTARFGGKRSNLAKRQTALSDAILLSNVELCR